MEQTEVKTLTLDLAPCWDPLPYHKSGQDIHLTGRFMWTIIIMCPAGFTQVLSSFCAVKAGAVVSLGRCLHSSLSPQWYQMKCVSKECASCKQPLFVHTHDCCLIPPSAAVWFTGNEPHLVQHVQPLYFFKLYCFLSAHQQISIDRYGVYS